MAQKATKTRAKSNSEALKNLHLGALVTNILFLAWHFLVSSRSLTKYVVFSIPAFLCQFALERAGRPKYHPQTSALVSAGEDLNQSGLTEYMFDCIWLTWVSLVLVMLFGNWGWLVWSVIPAFALYKGSALLGMARNMAGMGGMPQATATEGQSAGNRKQRRKA